ncbi:DUF4439 domain-containing protein [uncultured Friedmanniella sp.]|uniref:DUF4439 domain-containing protein n=1 Tax=uncultured Friedmanniella sp. TaxID=335381 RepID=UPI0035CBA72E
MPRPRLDDGPAGPPWSRRSLLVLGLSLSATACTVSDPTIRGTAATAPASAGRSATPSAPPRLTPIAATAVAERQLADLAGRVRTGTPKPSKARRALLRSVQATHLERASALASADPGRRPVGAPPADPQPGTGRSVKRLAEAERAAATRYRREAAATSGLTALLWGSMSVASDRYAKALADDDTPSASAPRQHRPMALVPDTTAVADLVGALHATVYGYQLALGRLETDSAAHDRATTGLRDRRVLLERLSERLTAAGADVPAAKPAYVPSLRVDDSATAGRLIGHLESALMPFCGLWLAAASKPADRRSALDALADTAARAERWGGDVQAWPGWRD